jgi:hypothetical protein
MASFVPRYCKKHEALNRREAELKRKVKEGAPELVVRALAEEVVKARVRALKEELANLPPYEGPDAARFHRIEERIRKAREVTVNDILVEFVGDPSGVKSRKVN